jgi:hypothetical protein
MVTDVEGFLRRREDAYMRAKLGSNPRFNGSRCTVESDREIVEKRLLEIGFASVQDFDVYVKEVADKTLEPFRKDYGLDKFWLERWDPASWEKDKWTFRAAEGDEKKCVRCDKLKDHHHRKKRDGITMDVWCCDFLLDL